MSSTTSSTITSVNARLDSSPVRRRIMTPTPLLLATRQSSTEDEDRSTTASIQGPAFFSSPTKSTHSKSSVRSDRSATLLKRQVSDEYRNLMTDNVYTTSASNSSRVSKPNDSTIRRKSRDINNQTNGEINSEMSSLKQCNRFGFFIDSDQTEVLP